MKKLLSVLLVCFTALACRAAIDTYGGATLLSLAAPASVSANTTNDAVDVHGFQGVLTIVSTVVSNSAAEDGGALVVNIQGSTNGTNYTTLSAAALSTASTITITNIAGGYGTNALYCINSYKTPGVTFTNSIIKTNTASAVTEYGYVAASLPGWLRVVYIVEGTNTVYGASVNLRGKRGQPYP